MQWQDQWFFSLAWGVCTIGDVETLSRIGKRMIGRFMLAQLLLAAAAVAVCLPFFHSSSAGGSSFQPAEIYELLLEIIPDNLITPFTTGNTEQIITLAVVAGIVLLLLGERGNPLTAFVEKMNAALYYLMSGVSTLIPFMVFFGMFKIAASGQFAAVLKSWKIPAMILALSILPMLLYTVIVAIRKRVSVLKLVRSASSVLLIGIMTASSSAALTENLERCEHSCGIDKKIVRFGVPLGQTIFMPGVVMFFISLSFGLGELQHRIYAELACVGCSDQCAACGCASAHTRWHDHGLYHSIRTAQHSVRGYRYCVGTEYHL